MRKSALLLMFLSIFFFSNAQETEIDYSIVITHTLDAWHATIDPVDSSAIDTNSNTLQMYLSMIEYLILKDTSANGESFNISEKWMSAIGIQHRIYVRFVKSNEPVILIYNEKNKKWKGGRIDNPTDSINVWQVSPAYPLDVSTKTLKTVAGEKVEMINIGFGQYGRWYIFKNEPWKNTYDSGLYTR